MSGSRRVRNALLASALLIVLLLPLLLPLFRVHWYRNHEGYSYVIRVIELRRCWDDGMLSARWFPDLNYGQGYPFLCFYAPLVFIVAGLVTLTSAGPILSLKVVAALAAAVGAVGAYRLVRRVASREAAAVSAALFTYAPYYVSDLHTRGDLAEFAAMGLLPWCVDGVLALRVRPSLRGSAGLGIAGAAVILTHNLLGMFAGAVMLVAAFVATATSGGRLRTASHAAVGGALALLLSSFFWLPALVERKFVKIEQVIDGPYAVAANFRPLVNLLGLGPPPGVAAGMPVSMELGWPAIVLAVVAVTAARRLPKEARALAIVAGVLLVGGGLMTTSVSKPIYDALPLLRFTQFPWRFAALAALGASTWAALGFEILTARWRPRLRAGAAVIAGVAGIAASWGGVAPGQALPLIPSFFEVETIRVQRANTTGKNEYMPIWARKVPPTGFQNGVRVVGDATVLEVTRRAGRYDLRVEARGPATIVLLDYYYPGWTATLDGRSVAMRPRAETGNIEIHVPAGTWALRAWLALTPLRATTAVLSAAAAGVTGLVFLLPSLRRRRREVPNA